jgi:hypothetical protein
MKTQIKKIVTIVIVLVFVGAGESFAQNWKDARQKPAANAYGFYAKDAGRHPDFSKKRYEPPPRYREKYVVKEVHAVHHDYDHKPSNSGVLLGISIFDPNMAFAIVLKGLR